MVLTVRVSVLLAAVLVAKSAAADLQLTPEAEDYDLDGAKLKRLVFSDGERRVTYTSPRGWHCSGSGARLVLQPPGIAQAEGIISVAALPEPQVFDEPTIKRLCEQTISSIPGDSTHVAVVSQQKNPVLIENKETVLIVINYDLYGTAYSRSVMFLNRKKDQVQFQFTAPRGDFASLQKQFLSSHFSWQNL